MIIIADVGDDVHSAERRVHASGDKNRVQFTCLSHRRRLPLLKGCIERRRRTVMLLSDGSKHDVVALCDGLIHNVDLGTPSVNLGRFTDRLVLDVPLA